MRLNDLGIKYGCDKSDRHHTFKGQTYLDVYETYFSKFRDEPISFLELGVRDGASTKIWSDYFTNAKVIVGIDIMPGCKTFETNRVKIEIGSQADPDFINSVIEKHGPFHVILDDASHINELSLKSFELLKNSVIEGGYYIIEDLRNSYEDLTQDVRLWPGMNLNNNLNADNSATRPDFDRVMLDVVRDLDYRKSDFRSVNFHSQLVVLAK